MRERSKTFSFNSHLISHSYLRFEKYTKAKCYMLNVKKFTWLNAAYIITNIKTFGSYDKKTLKTKNNILNIKQKQLVGFAVVFNRFFSVVVNVQNVASKCQSSKRDLLINIGIKLWICFQIGLHYVMKHNILKINLAEQYSYTEMKISA